MYMLHEAFASCKTQTIGEAVPQARTTAAFITAAQQQQEMRGQSSKQTQNKHAVYVFAWNGRGIVLVVVEGQKEEQVS